LKEVEESYVIAYDATISRRSRAMYLLNYLTAGEYFQKVALDTTGEIVGIGCVRAVYSNDSCLRPLFADSEVNIVIKKTAVLSLLAGILSTIPDLKKYKMFVCVHLAVNENADRLFQSIGGTQVKIVPFAQRQFTKKVFPTNDSKMFTVTDGACGIV
uniref:Acetyltransf_18 domain-containing protein n=1 Tax=Angiostrongylus cantonensis TaxID=6313 RepID=A0A0K0DQR4_ANGCA